MPAFLRRRLSGGRLPLTPTEGIRRAETDLNSAGASIGEARNAIGNKDGAADGAAAENPDAVPDGVDGLGGMAKQASGEIKETNAEASVEKGRDGDLAKA